MAKLENGQLGELIQASAGQATGSHPHPGEGAEVKGSVEVSQDATHDAFVAAGVLTEEANSVGDSAEAGADNLYISAAEAGEVKFVARLCSGPEESGTTRDAGCSSRLNRSEGAESNNDDPLWLAESGPPEAHFTPDGRYLVFASEGQLVPGDTDNVQDIYRYDFETGQLLRISIGRDGNDGNGNDDRFPALIGHHAARGPEPDELTEDGYRSISSDGSIVVFQTAAPLVSRDTDTGNEPGCGQHTTGCDVYEWEQQGHGTCTEAGGCISLISDGVNPQGATNPVISPSGRDVIFGTRRNEIPADTDGIGDAYDARVNGGFPPPAPPSPCGSGEACHPATEPGGTSPVLGSESFVGPGNSATSLQCAKGRHRVKKHNEFRCIPNHRKKHRAKKGHHKAKQGRSNINAGGAN